MGESRIGRVVVASLHQALADHLPTRLEFYESYLRPLRMRAGAVGLASFSAALSFLTHEDDAWDPVMRSAGHHAAQWMWEAQPAWRRAWWARAPRAVRRRTALRLTRALVHATSEGSSARVRRRDRQPVLVIAHSAFCDVRQRGTAVRCGLYAAALGRFLELVGVNDVARITECRATHDGPCVLSLDSEVAASAGTRQESSEGEA